MSRPTGNDDKSISYYHTSHLALRFTWCFQPNERLTMNTLHLMKAATSTLLFLALPAAHAGGWTGNVSGYLGLKSLEEKDWSDLDRQTSLGVLFDIKRKNWPISIAFDLIGSGDINEHGSQKDEGYTGENHLGIRKIFEVPDSSIKPYLSGGVAFISAEIKNKSGETTGSQDDDATGTWIGGGLYAQVQPHFNLGFDVRFSDAEVRLFNVDRESGGLLAGATAGYHW